jgi:ADP-ribose pyrophosphatase
MTTPSGARHVGPYDILHSRPVYENPWIKVREDKVRTGGGEESTFGVITMRPGVTVLPMEESGEVHLVREFRYALGEETLEAVGGAIESGETPEMAGLRELTEELNLIASQWVYMGVVNPFTTIVHAPNHLFLAQDLSSTRRAPQVEERLGPVRMPFEEAVRAVLRGQITHAASCVLILKAQAFLERKGRK